MKNLLWLSFTELPVISLSSRCHDDIKISITCIIDVTIACIILLKNLKKIKKFLKSNKAIYDWVLKEYYCYVSLYNPELFRHKIRQILKIKNVADLRFFEFLWNDESIYGSFWIFPGNLQFYFMYVLTILTGKNFYFTEFSTKIHWNTRLAASDVFHMFTQSIKFF